eukprot:TRINITY_DN28795_c0_g1_i1.p1 TRINITY_DN28795_c0_g1~~TRINITY_DN28795_c0_g1_i1.p1  ORF type:complete len:244 (+),score=70.46 TRINITY_DN28795_c0_g1_i1:93-824(+)
MAPVDSDAPAVGKKARVKTTGRIGEVVKIDDEDDECTFKMHFKDGEKPEKAWFGKRAVEPLTDDEGAEEAVSATKSAEAAEPSGLRQRREGGAAAETAGEEADMMNALVAKAKDGKQPLTEEEKAKLLEMRNRLVAEYESRQVQGQDPNEDFRDKLGRVNSEGKLELTGWGQLLRTCLVLVVFITLNELAQYLITGRGLFFSSIPQPPSLGAGGLPQNLDASNPRDMEMLKHLMQGASGNTDL